MSMVFRTMQGAVAGQAGSGHVTLRCASTGRTEKLERDKEHDLTGYCAECRAAAEEAGLKVKPAPTADDIPPAKRAALLAEWAANVDAAFRRRNANREAGRNVPRGITRALAAKAPKAPPAELPAGDPRPYSRALARRHATTEQPESREYDPRRAPSPYTRALERSRRPAGDTLGGAA